MNDGTMREAFEAYCKRDGVPPDLMDDEYEVWQAAYAAGMERAAGIVEGLNDSAGDAASYDGRDMYASEEERMQAISACADAIRAEIPKGGNE